MNSITPDTEQHQAFNDRLRAWYLASHRPLLWRSTQDAYKIWLSEIILQQTRVSQGTPYYIRFTEQFPTVFDLAAAEEKEVLRLWQGLGYYSRARNMHHTAQEIVKKFGGVFPGTAKELVRLKGLGNYTAAAIASFAFGEVVPAIDGNVYRVLSRIFGIADDILSNEGKRKFEELSWQLISRDDPATYNQAMIELGAIQCVPVSPDCGSCLFSVQCYAYAHKKQGQLPVKIKKTTVKNRYLHYFILEQNGRIAMRFRNGKDIWKGLYDFYLIEAGEPVLSPEMLDRDPYISDWKPYGTWVEIPGTFVHVLTHQRLHVRFWRILIGGTQSVQLAPEMAFYDPEQVEILPKPILIDQVLKSESLL